MRRDEGLSLAQLLVAVAALAITMALIAFAVTRGRDEARRRRCQNNLWHLAKGVCTYAEGCHYYPWPAGYAGCGTERSPSFGGAEWLAMVYWARVMPDPYVFVCPSSEDGNDDGRKLGIRGTPDGRPMPRDAVSYAGLGDVSFGVYEAARGSKGASYANSKVAIYIAAWDPSGPMICDDTEGAINHCRRGNAGMNVFFWDIHTEFWSPKRVDLEHGVGKGELLILRN